MLARICLNLNVIKGNGIAVFSLYFCPASIQDIYGYSFQSKTSWQPDEILAK